VSAGDDLGESDREFAERRLGAMFGTETLRPIATTYLELQDGDILLVSFPEETPHAQIRGSLDRLARALEARGVDVDVFGVPPGTTISALTKKSDT